jgi:hypothetical protein
LAPWFIPETTKSGVQSNKWLKLSFTQSTGVPLLLNVGTPWILSAGEAMSGWSTVIPQPFPDMETSEEITATSPKVVITSTSSRKPLAWIPSSLVTNIKGVFAIIVFNEKQR